MATVEGAKELMGRLEWMRTRATADARVRVAVGYGAPYALVIHEDLTLHHANGQAKFLEQPARAMRAELGKIVREAVEAGVPLPEAELKAAERLKEASQALCPVLTGKLRDSAYARAEQ